MAKMCSYIVYLVLILTLFLSYNVISGVNDSDYLLAESSHSERRGLLRDENTPLYNFYIEPIQIASTCNGYFFGGQTAIPLRFQSEGYGAYLIYQVMDLHQALMRVRYSYFYSGDIVADGYVDLLGGAYEASPGIYIDSITNNPFVTYHSYDALAPGVFSVALSYDNFHLMEVPGLWNEVYWPIDNIGIPHDLLPQVLEGDQFKSPEIFVGTSPLGGGQRRVYLVGWNFAFNDEGLNCQNCLVAWADFLNVDDISSFDLEQWSYTTVPQFDEWRTNNLKSYVSTLIDWEGNLIFAGHTKDFNHTQDDISPDEFFFVVKAVDIDSGVWETYTTDSNFEVENPINPETGQGYWLNPDTGEPYGNLRYTPKSSRHTAVIDDQGDLHYLTNLVFKTQTDTWVPLLTGISHLKFSPETSNFEIRNLYPGQTESEHHLPWTVDEEGYIDLETGLIYSYPAHHYSDFHSENYTRIISKNNWMLALFQDTTKSLMYTLLGEEEYEPWLGIPETYLYVSNDYGLNWSNPVKLSSISDPALEGMVPAYWYIADDIEPLYGDWGRIHLVFLDRTEYGSSEQGELIDWSGEIMYTVLDIDFGLELKTDFETCDSSLLISAVNYPNPFNPSTNIEFVTPQEQDLVISVYNTKGQLVKELANRKFPAGENSVVWNGMDCSGNPVSSGVYFYSITGRDISAIGKMILLK